MKILIGIPTLNEKKNVSLIFRKIKKLNLKLDILFLDDNSKDGTLEEIDNIKNNNKNVLKIVRNKKLGIGSAHKEIIKYSKKKKYDLLVTMDADGSHDPAYIIKMLNLIENNSDIVITNRFYFRNSLESWPWYRKLITKLRHIIINALLNINLDTSGAFRIYNLNKIPSNHLLKAKHNGYSFFWESIYYFSHYKYVISEIPIRMKSRTYGSSKINIYEILSAIYYLVYIFLRKLFRLKL